MTKQCMPMLGKYDSYMSIIYMSNPKYDSRKHENDYS